MTDSSVHASENGDVDGLAAARPDISCMADPSIDYYNRNAREFFSDTVDVDMSALHSRFLAHIPEGGLILDAGCGSGRDTKAFLTKGYRVVAFDASPEMAALAGTHLQRHIPARTFADVHETACYDGIWACASLLHVPLAALPIAISQLWQSLRPGGAFYLSFKAGDGERVTGGRHFTALNGDALRQLAACLDNVAEVTCWESADLRPGRSDMWFNAIILRAPRPHSRLVTGGADPFLPHLREAIARSREIDMAVSFVKITGLRLLFDTLQQAITAHDANPRPPARLRVITSDYLDVTDPEALRLLMLLAERGAQVKVFNASKSSFHMKAYLFLVGDQVENARGTAFVGSSNISQQALQVGLEWNYRVDDPAAFSEIRNRFEELFADPRASSLTYSWIEEYERRRRIPPTPVAPGSDETELPPHPTRVQVTALEALAKSRTEGYRRGLVVMATGLGKTWLAAFDTHQANAKRILFVAHREEILLQAESTFLRIRPHARVGFFTGQKKDEQVDLLCASVQTLGKAAHLERFPPNHFDYVIVDEFHHASASTYRRLLNHLHPQFLLGLTATPERTDQSDILSLCDDNLVFTCNLLDGIRQELLAPFHYYGILDEEVDYREIPWRNGKFDPEQLSNKLATLARARHAHREWKDKAQTRTLAFCASIRHAEFMAEQFSVWGARACAVYAGSPTSRADALSALAEGTLDVLFSVDLFNEGVDIPAVDTVLMLRPTESKILFLQQLGRGLRLSEGKSHLVVLDFIGNHKSFLHKPQSLFELDQSSYSALADLARHLAEHSAELPAGCFVNYDLRFIDFLKSLDGNGTRSDYDALKASLGRRPTLTEFYRGGSSVPKMRQEFGSWVAFLQNIGDLTESETPVVNHHGAFLREVETTAMEKSYKMVLLESLQESSGWSTPSTIADLASQARIIFGRRRLLISDLPDELKDLNADRSRAWDTYWRTNPVKAWIGGNKSKGSKAWFKFDDDKLSPIFAIDPDEQDSFVALVQELVDYRFASYEVRIAPPAAQVISFTGAGRNEVPFFPDIRIACGHFKTGTADVHDYRALGSGYGKLDPSRLFIARASGNSMNGGKQPIADGDYLLLERVTPTSAGSITGTVMAIERQDETGDNQYLLRLVTKTPAGSYILKASNPEYPDMVANDDMRTFARLKAIVNPLDVSAGQAFRREEIPGLFGETFNPGNWQAGHVVLTNRKTHILLVTLNKQGQALTHRYQDRWIDERTFHWQTQNSTTPTCKRGRELIEHEQHGISIHLFVRDAKLAGGKAAPFTYHGPVRYLRHTGSAPMSIEWQLT